MNLWRFVIAKGMTWRDNAKEVSRFLKRVTLSDLQDPETWSTLADTAFVESVRTYYKKTDQFFGGVEELRMNLAKHEVPRSPGLVSEMPGYARIDQITGTLYWQFIGAHGGLEKLDRREIANFFLGIEVPDWDLLRHETSMADAWIIERCAASL